MKQTKLKSGKKYSKPQVRKVRLDAEVLLTVACKAASGATVSGNVAALCKSVGCASASAGS